MGGLSTGVVRETLGRFVLPAVLFAYTSWAFSLRFLIPLWLDGQALGDFGYFVVQGVLLVLTAALTPRSTSRTRRIGYAAAAINAVGGATFVLVPATRFMSDYGIWRYYLAAALITAAFCYRDIRTRRSGS